MDIADPTNNDASMNRTSSQQGVIVGSVVALLGAAIFFGASFLPFYSLTNGPAGGGPTTSFFRQFNLMGFHGVGALMFAYGATAIVLVTGLLALLRRSRMWAIALAVGVAAWVLTWGGFFLFITKTATNQRSGYWVMSGGLIVGLVGAIVAVLSGRERDEPISSENDEPTTPTTSAS